MLYFSYAANLNHSHMKKLCPVAEPLYPAVLPGYTLTVRQWFNVEPDKSGTVHGGVWQVEEGCLPRLDSYEDYPLLYTKQVLKIRVQAGAWNVEGGKWKDTMECMVYLMRQPFEVPFSPPDPEYLKMVREGYKEWGISSEQFDISLKKVSYL